MARRPPVGKCVHCFADPVERSWDHVFPQSWYPTTAPDLYKWRVPSCIPCNAALGAIEENFLRLVGLCLDPDHPASQSVVQKNLRSMTPAAAATDQERRIRAALRQRVLDQALTGEAVSQYVVYPGMEEKWERPPEERDALRIPIEWFSRVTEKIVRGLFYVEEKKFIEPPYAVEFLPPHYVELFARLWINSAPPSLGDPRL